MSLKRLFFYSIVALLSFISLPTLAQDLLAKQAPVDHNMRNMDTLALRSVMDREENDLTANSLYDEWSNEYTHHETALPDSFRINLRGFHMPTDNRVITSNFGPRWGRTHKGLDIKVYIGDTIRAAWSGKVRIVKYEAAGYGKYVVIRHPNGLETIYGHMSAWLVKENQTVKAGQPIGLGGNTGRSTGSHLHFETRLCGVALNPAIMFDFRNQDVVADSYMFRKSNYKTESTQANALRGKDAKGTYTPSNVASAPTPNQSSASKTMDQSKAVRYHKVTVGETLTSIAKRRNTTVDKLCRLNNLTRTVKVRPGQLLRYN